MSTSLSAQVSHGQLVIFQTALSEPFNDWSDQHISQGFSWRPGSVSFLTMTEGGQHSIEVIVTDRLGSVDPEALRAIEVPFDVPAEQTIEIGSLIETFPLSLSTGSYLLRCEFLLPDSSEEGRVRLAFARNERPRFAIVRQDAELSSGRELLTTAQPAAC